MYKIWRDMGLALMEDAPYKVDMAQVIEAAGKTHLLYRLEYPNTGHLMEPPFSPHFRATNLTLHGTKDKVPAINPTLVSYLPPGNNFPHASSLSSRIKIITS
ncbi:hypothetical protein CRENBAI_007384 [Crenichthys baileyi]|uniref:BAAT/Acyl-CoA thioester hydrolase C-terminal domain-containing protein n=1 Tax=Crenichthys baileyi TaxID=28760 RepID=A0AAV9SF55_9TELE